MAETAQNPAATGCIVAVLMLGALIGVSKCARPAGNGVRPFISPSLGNQIEAMATSVPVRPLDAAAMRKGAGRFKLVLDAQGLSGAMIYSQNCYDALARKFSWAKLDGCGAFDMLAVKAAATADTRDIATELEYFGPEAAAGRYLVVATRAGEEAGEADGRLDVLQHGTPAGTAPAKPKAPRPVKATPGDRETPSDDSIERGDV